MSTYILRPQVSPPNVPLVVTKYTMNSTLELALVDISLSSSTPSLHILDSGSFLRLFGRFLWPHPPLWVPPPLSLDSPPLVKDFSSLFVQSSSFPSLPSFRLPSSSSYSSFLTANPKCYISSSRTLSSSQSSQLLFELTSLKLSLNLCPWYMPPALLRKFLKTIFHFLLLCHRPPPLLLLKFFPQKILNSLLS